LFGLSDRILVLDFGKRIAEGTPRDVTRDPLVIEAYLGTEQAKEIIPAILAEHASLEESPPETDEATENYSETNEQTQEATSSISLVEKAIIEEETLPLLQISHVSTAYGSFQALFGVSLDIREGEIVALIGLNGAGKTTLIRALTRRLPLKEGDVIFKGKSIAHMQPYEIAELGIAQSLEGRKIFPELTVLENLELGAYCKRARVKRHETLKQVYNLFHVLAERRHQRGSTLSGGQQQMLAIGRALMARPELIIFDEISLGLAPIVIDELYKAIAEINRQGMSVLLVEQSVQRSLNIAQRAYIIEHGQIVLSGTVESLRENAEFRQVYFGL
jgi:branched-chain amino acid transport system ATP-binding protein